MEQCVGFALEVSLEIVWKCQLLDDTSSVVVRMVNPS